VVLFINFFVFPLLKKSLPWGRYRSVSLIFLSFYLLSGKWKFGNKELGVQIGSNFESHFSRGWRWWDIIRSWS